MTRAVTLSPFEHHLPAGPRRLLALSTPDRARRSRTDAAEPINCKPTMCGAWQPVYGGLTATGRRLPRAKRVTRTGCREPQLIEMGESNPPGNPDYRSPRLRARQGILASALALALASVLSAGLATWALVAGGADRWGAAAAALAFGALVMTMIAIAVALITYRATIQLPKLDVRVYVGWPSESRFELPWNFAFFVDQLPETARLDSRVTDLFSRDKATDLTSLIRVEDDTTLQVWLVNSSEFLARNPSVVVTLSGFDWMDPDQPGWTMTRDARGFRLQWDGGADLAVHGCWRRPLPPVRLANALFVELSIQNTPSTWEPSDRIAVEIKWVADGFTGMDSPSFYKPIPQIHFLDVMQRNADETRKRVEAMREQLALHRAARDL
jgi:hypothetical protein